MVNKLASVLAVTFLLFHLCICDVYCLYSCS